MPESRDGCPEFDERLLESAFAPSLDARLDRHLAACARCRRARNRYLQTADAITASLASMPPAGSARKRGGARRWIVAAGGGLAAALALGVGLLWGNARPFRVAPAMGAVVRFEGRRALTLESGEARFEVSMGPLEVGTPAGSLHCRRGEFTVSVVPEEETNVSSAVRRIGAVVTVTVAVGLVVWATREGDVEIPAGGSEQRRSTPLPSPPSASSEPPRPAAPESADSRMPSASPAGASSAEGGRSVEVGLSAEPVHQLAGVVVYARTSLPVEGLDLTLARTGGGRLHLATTDAKGRFASRAPLEPGSAVIEAPGIPGGLDADSSFETLRLAHVEIGAADLTALRLEYPWSGRLEGIVVDPEGAPVAGAEVRVHSTRRFFRDWSAIENTGRAGRADAGGRFEFDRLPADHALFVAAWAPGFAHASSANVTASLEGDPPAVIRLVRLGRITGRLLGRSGESIADTVVEATLQTHEGKDMRCGASHRTRTDQTGQFAIETVEPGSYYVCTKDAAFRTESRPPRAIVRGGDTVEVELRFEEEMRSLAGVVVDPDGRPLPGVRVRIDAAGDQKLRIQTAVETKEEGRFSADFLTAGRYRLRAQKGMFTDSDEVEADAGDEDVRIVWWDPKCELEIRVLDAASRRPIAGADVIVSRGPMSSIALSTGEEGVVSGKLPVHAGTYTVLAGARGKAPSRRTVEIDRSTEGAARVDLLLEPGRTATGRVVDERGNPVAGVRVGVRGDGSTVLASTVVVSAADGTFVVDSLPRAGGKLALVMRAVDAAAPGVEAGEGEVRIVVPDE